MKSEPGSPLSFCVASVNRKTSCVAVASSRLEMTRGSGGTFGPALPQPSMSQASLTAASARSRKMRCSASAIAGGMVSMTRRRRRGTSGKLRA